MAQSNPVARILQRNYSVLAFAERFNHALDLNLIQKSIQRRKAIVAKRFNISQTQAFSWLQGICLPSVKSQIAIAKSLEVNPDWLIYDIGAPLKHIHKTSQRQSLPIYYLSQHTGYKLLFDSYQGKRYVSSDTVSENSYVVHLFDNQFAPLFPANSKLVVDPDANPQDRDYVLIFLARQGKIVCGILLHFDSSQLIICPLSNQALALSNHDILLGTILFAETQFSQLN